MAKGKLILCDSTVFIHLLRGNDKVLADLLKIGAPHTAISIITQAEVFHGAKNKADLEQYKRIFSPITVLPLTEEISKIFNGPLLNYTLSHKVMIADMLIAATAISMGYRLFTHNRKDFDFIPEIKLYNP